MGLYWEGGKELILAERMLEDYVGAKDGKLSFDIVLG